MTHPERYLPLLLAFGAIVALATPARAQSDIQMALWGTWQGVVHPPERGNPARILVVESIVEQNGRWLATGGFGIPGKPLAPIEIEVDTSGERPSLRFTTATKATVSLSLLDDTHMVGTLAPAGAAHRDVVESRSVKLEKLCTCRRVLRWRKETHDTQQGGGGPVMGQPTLAERDKFGRAAPSAVP